MGNAMDESKVVMGRIIDEIGMHLESARADFQNGSLMMVDLDVGWMREHLDELMDMVREAERKEVVCWG
jgi:hypothetical protein